MAGAGDVDGRLTGCGQRLAHRVAHQRNAIRAVPGRGQTLGHAIGAPLELPPDPGDGGYRPVHRKGDQNPQKGPHRDDGVAEQLGQQAAGGGGVGQQP
ncbi:hypothetical protein MTER_04950 [Mycolicibacter terrae]|uniref:Uncharacterized protein n=1 Tax=Mycolicibacter terrae TaxID=1788 RepID=A0AAD1HTW5_9MYCO|nr:hypothetical protein MTER_04950 [Mycolicibacter terrae]